jgi:hypothetical protein
MPALKWLVVDIETVGRPDVVDYLDDLTPRGNLKDPEKIAADLAEKRAAALATAALDWNANAIVAIGYQTEQDATPRVLLCRDEEEEADALRTLWLAYTRSSRRLVTFNGYGFDVPVLLQRSRLLGVTEPRIDQRKYSNVDQIDLFKHLTFDDMRGTSVIKRSLRNFGRLFKLDLPIDPVDGAQIGALVAAGDWPAIVQHVTADVITTRLLAERLHLIDPVVTVEAVA